MVLVITFRTARFDISKETPNPINPIAGQSVLQWLRTELAKSLYQCDEPATEDWGWYMGVSGASATYLVGASADAEGAGPEVEWTLQVHKSRSLKDKLLGRGALAADDALCVLLERIVGLDPMIEQVTVEHGG